MSFPIAAIGLVECLEEAIRRRGFHPRLRGWRSVAWMWRRHPSLRQLDKDSYVRLQNTTQRLGGQETLDCHQIGPPKATLRDHFHAGIHKDLVWTLDVIDEELRRFLAPLPATTLSDIGTARCEGIA